jgi:cell division septation protein DedD
MTRTENEQELVLGNKQLLSAFFVVVALLGVFFTMGYVIGRNTAVPEVGATKKSAVDRPSDAPPVSLSTEPATSPAAAAPPPVVPLPQKTEPAHTTPEYTKAEPPKVEAHKVEATRTAPPVEKPAEAATPVLKSDVIVGHTYLQVMAVKRPVADNTVKLLKGHGLPALLGESSKPDLYRVLVGPYSDNEALANAKTELKKMGFDAFVSK